MKSKNPRILILGASGMVGRTVFKYLSNELLDVTGTVRKKSGKNQMNFIFSDKSSLNKLFKKYQFDCVINCIGILKKNNKGYGLNFALPKNLESLSIFHKFKIINISSDDVYDSLSKKANEKTKTKPDNPYGKSKLKGEIISKNVLNIRTSFIGFDPIEKKGLIEWLIQNENKEVDGFVNQTWSGCTTLQFAKLCKYLVNNFRVIRRKTPVVNFVPIGPLTKFELVKAISKSLKLKIKINKHEANEEINRYLISLYFDNKFFRRYTTEINKAVKELINFENK